MTDKALLNFSRTPVGLPGGRDGSLGVFHWNRKSAGPSVTPGSVEVLCVFAPAAALLAAHRAFIAAASCARRSGVRLSFLFTFLATLRSSMAADFLFFLAT